MYVCVLFLLYGGMGEWKWRKGAGWKGFVMLKHGHFVEGRRTLLIQKDVDFMTVVDCSTW